MTSTQDNRQFFSDKMGKENLSPLVISTFLSHYDQLNKTGSGYIAEETLLPVEEKSLPQYENLSAFEPKGKEVLKESVVIKLNGGLGTSMGLNGPKCLLPVKNNLSFFDITIRRILELNKELGIHIPLLLMNSFMTDADTQKLLDSYPDIKTNIPNSFIQNKYPKILCSSLLPAQNNSDTSYEWNPPGHGDIYTSLAATGILKKLLDAGIKYAFVSNIDNLGATMDTGLLGYFAKNNLPFMMEVARRTEMDKKGGHIARLKKDNRLVLREIAQAPADALTMFQDINRYRFFNTNNIWVNLEYLQELFENQESGIQLPLIKNKKNMIPSDINSPEVFQLETAMGSAIASFENSEAVIIPKSRFKPVKKFDDLMILWSDIYNLSETYELSVNSDRKIALPNVSLDSKFYGKHKIFSERFPKGVPSLIECESLKIEGDILFGENVIIKGSVTLTNTQKDKQVFIQDNSLIEEDIRY